MIKYESKFIGIPLILGIVSASLISYQLHLINILSITQWHHFAYMVIAIALLGFGASGTFLAIFKDFLLSKINFLLPALVLLTHIFIPLSVSLSQTELFYFDSYKIFTDISYLIKLPAFYLLFFLPFFFGSMIIGLLFVNNTEKIGILYFTNMFGSGAGALSSLLFMETIPPESLAAFISSLSLILCLAAFSTFLKKGFYSTLVISIAAVIIINLLPVSLQLSEYKNLSNILNLPQSKVIKTDYSPYGKIDLVESPFLRYSPGLSMKFNAKVGIINSAFNNGDWKGPLMKSASNGTPIFRFSTENLPYILKERNRSLILNSGTGRYIHQALKNKTDQIVAVEPNVVLTDLLRSEYSYLVDSVYSYAKVSVKNTLPRSFLLSSDEKFDLIHLPVIDAFGGTSGLSALEEDYLLTKNSFSEMISILSDSGVISVSTWIDYPYKNALKIIATLAESLAAEGITYPRSHIAAVKNWNNITITAKKTPINYQDMRRITAFCHEMNFDPVILGSFPVSRRNYYNKLNDTLFFSYLDDILESREKREKLYTEYPFNIEPASDNKPYYAQFLKWKSLKLISENYGDSLIPFFEIGYLLLYLTFFQISLISLVLIILPLVFYSKSREKPVDALNSSSNLFKIFLYFAGIGLGYIFFEIISIQRFQLYFGNVIYSTAFVISLLLISSGLGSLYSHTIKRNRIKMKRIFIAVIIFIALSLLLLDPLIKSTVHFNIFIKVTISCLFISPAGFFMGMPFPLGLRILSENKGIEIPWAWGINGIFSVIGVTAAAIISVEIGFAWLLFFICLSYFISMMSGLGDN